VVILSYSHNLAIFSGVGARCRSQRASFDVTLKGALGQATCCRLSFEVYSKKTTMNLTIAEWKKLIRLLRRAGGARRRHGE
jgi:hypothetical protein